MLKLISVLLIAACLCYGEYTWAGTSSENLCETNIPPFIGYVYGKSVDALFGKVAWRNVIASENIVNTSPSSNTGILKRTRTGVTTPGVQIPIVKLKPDAVVKCPGESDWLAISDDAVWVSITPEDVIARIDPKRNEVVQVIKVGKYPSSGLAVGFGSLWVPNCADNTLSRVDLKTGIVTNTLQVGAAASEGLLAAGLGSVVDLY